MQRRKSKQKVVAFFCLLALSCGVAATGVAREGREEGERGRIGLEIKRMMG